MTKQTIRQSGAKVGETVSIKWGEGVLTGTLSGGVQGYSITTESGWKTWIGGSATKHEFVGQEA